MKNLLCTAFILAIGGVLAEPTPYTHQNFLDDPAEFHFAIVPDRTGGDYRGAFTNALAKVNLMRPEFVMSVGDLIPASWERPESVIRQQVALTNMLAKVVPPFYCVVGNHDISRTQPRFPTANADSTRVWKEFFGPNTYYSFVYKNVLFLCLNTMEQDPDNEYKSCMTETQYEWIRKTLSEHPDVRWTFLFMHQPGVWDTAAWRRLEDETLAKRRYSVFAGDWHAYYHARRNGHDYYVLSVAGGCSAMSATSKERPNLRGTEYGEMDHITWVTVTKDGPVVANLVLSGILPGDYLNQENTKSTYHMKPIDIPPNPVAVKRFEEREAARKSAAK